MIDSSNADIYCERAKQFIYNNNEDSLFRAFLILNRLFRINPIKYSQEFLKPFYTRIDVINQHNIEANIIGTWAFERGNDYFYDETNIEQKGEQITFKNDTAYFHLNNKLIRKTLYSIRNRWEPFNFQVYFHDCMTAVDISFSSEKARMDWMFEETNKPCKISWHSVYVKLSDNCNFTGQ